MNKYIFYVSDIVSSTYEVIAESEDDARVKLDDIFADEPSYISDDRHEIVSCDITLLETSPAFSVNFDGQNLTVQTQNGEASMNLCELIDELCAKADGGNE